MKISTGISHNEVKSPRPLVFLDKSGLRRSLDNFYK